MTEEEYLAAQHRVEVAVAAYLAKPPVRKQHYADEHTWSLASWHCVKCGISKLQFHNAAYGLGLPCKEQVNADV